MVYKNIFVVDLSHMQSIKQLRDGPLSVGCMSCLYICLDDKFEILEMTGPSVGCTCPTSRGGTAEIEKT